MILIHLIAVLILNPQRGSGPAAGGAISQHRINEMAAAFLAVRREILQSDRMRMQGETLPAYCLKITKPLPAENTKSYELRLKDYEWSLKKLDTAKLILPLLPKLQNTSPANIAIWDRIYRQLKYLPDRLQKVHKAIDLAKKKHDGISMNKLGSELLLTIQLDVAVYDLLRDALP